MNERAILSSLDALTEIQRLNISVNLPKLHPYFETPERHFMKEGFPPLFELERRLRQRYHAVDVGNGQFRIQYAPDFPSLRRTSITENMTDDEIEERERINWKDLAQVSKTLWEIDSSAALR